MDPQLLDLLGKGCLLGLAAGFSPGPLTVLVIGETLRHGLRSGLQVAIAPILTDIPIILMAMLALERLLGWPFALGAVSLAGGAFLLWLGYRSLRVAGVDIPAAGGEPHSIRKGIAINLLNPNPYVFWVSVGVPAILNALAVSWGHVAAFLGAFFFCIVGSKALLAKLVHGSRAFMRSGVYLWSMRLLGGLLMGYGLLLMKDGAARILGG
ncbi:MAG: LysE family transporter [Desulfobacterales bacterium]|jgi:threonine/homoserine/homoserine lactone efflux protein|nr:LysE family transporter [Desulfobacterales bacterium]